MKDKLLQMRVDEEFLSKLDYLKDINGYKNNSDTVTKTIEKEFRKEKIRNKKDSQCFWYIEKCTLLNNPPCECIGCYDRESLEEFCNKRKIKLSVTESNNPTCVTLTVSGKKKTLTRDVPKSQDKRMYFVDMVLMYIKR